MSNCHSVNNSNQWSFWLSLHHHQFKLVIHDLVKNERLVQNNSVCYFKAVNLTILFVSSLFFIIPNLEMIFNVSWDISPQKCSKIKFFYLGVWIHIMAQTVICHNSKTKQYCADIFRSFFSNWYKHLAQVL